jgi:FkbM family methyltransferase
MPVLGGRPIGFVARNALRPGNYRSLARAVRTYEHPASTLERYFRGSGDYPARIGVRTPAGMVHPKAWTSHDVITINEVFCRLDYEIEAQNRVVVDIGSNVGISALYFLTRGPGVRCILFEPVPQNVARLRENLVGFEGRWTLHETAVADRAGTLPFVTEPTGRYGGLDRAGDEADSIMVRVEHVNDVLARVLAEHGRIDVLKVDTEGSEAATVRAIAPEILARIGRIYCEDEDGEIDVPGWARRLSCDTTRLDNPAYSAS